MEEKYDKNKFHGNLIVDSKCKMCWQEGDFCLHQLYEIIVGKVNPKFIVKRDFKKEVNYAK
jgi:hypothetical protein